VTDKEFCLHGNIFQKETTAKYDKVLLDAPCSGLGVLSKVHISSSSSPPKVHASSVQLN
jgi:16S rRNA C967 or C1407 C5-methylase (RsmB/RsmF family)